MFINIQSHKLFQFVHSRNNFIIAYIDCHHYTSIETYKDSNLSVKDAFCHILSNKKPAMMKKYKESMMDGFLKSPPPIVKYFVVERQVIIDFRSIKGLRYFRIRPMTF